MKSKRSLAAAAMGRARSERKAAAVRENGKLGGRRPKASQLTLEEWRELRRLQAMADLLNPEGRARLKDLATRNRPDPPS